MKHSHILQNRLESQRPRTTKQKIVYWTRAVLAVLTFGIVAHEAEEGFF